MNDTQKNELIEQVVRAIIASIPSQQTRDHVAKVLQDKYGAWWIDPQRILK